MTPPIDEKPADDEDGQRLQHHKRQRELHADARAPQESGDQRNDARATPHNRPEPPQDRSRRRRRRAGRPRPRGGRPQRESCGRGTPSAATRAPATPAANKSSWLTSNRQPSDGRVGDPELQPVHLGPPHRAARALRGRRRGRGSRGKSEIGAAFTNGRKTTRSMVTPRTSITATDRCQRPRERKTVARRATRR